MASNDNQAALAIDDRFRAWERELTAELSPTIYLLIEEAARELDAKLLVGGCAAELGFDVVIGQQWLLNVNWQHLPPGIVVFKGNNAIQHKNIRNAKAAGHRIATIEEEALGVVDAVEILRLYNPGIENDCDLFLMQGEFQRSVLSARNPGAAEKMVVTGNPRIDLLRQPLIRAWDDESRRIRDEFGRFVLVNTNYATVNSHWGDMLTYYEVCANARVFREDSPDDWQVFQEQVSWERANLQAMTELICLLEDELDGMPIIVRPHPAERIELWQDALEGRDRIRVIREGNHLPWTLASEILVHTSCTTGAEAFLANQPAVGLRVGNSRFHGFFLSDQVNPTFSSPRDAAQFVTAHLSDASWFEEDRARRSSVVEHHLGSLSGLLAAERIAKELCARLPSQRSQDEWRPHPGFISARYLTQMRSTKAAMTATDLRHRLISLGQLLGRFGGLDVVDLGQALFRIGSAGGGLAE